LGNNREITVAVTNVETAKGEKESKSGNE
jgi:hypothetical protein